MSKGKHPTVTVWKVSNTLKAAGISDEAAEAIITRLRGGNKNRPELRLKRSVQKKILQALANDGKCGLVLTRTNRVMVMTGDHINIPHWEKNLLPFKQQGAKTYQTSKPHLTQAQREALKADIRAGQMKMPEIAQKYGINLSTAHYYKGLIKNGMVQVAETVGA